MADQTAASPPPDSWASKPEHELGIWNIEMEAGAIWTLPKASPGVNRMVYYYEGQGLEINHQSIPKYSSVRVMPEYELEFKSGAEAAQILVLQGKPINEPVIQYGPFVMNTKEEIQQAFEDYHRTQFGGWPWSRYDQVHARNKSRFAKHSDGKEEIKE